MIEYKGKMKEIILESKETENVWLYQNMYHIYWNIRQELFS